MTLDRVLTRVGCFGGGVAAGLVTVHGWNRPDQLLYTIVATVLAAICGYCWSRLEDE